MIKNKTIDGYRTLNEEELDLIRECKALSEECGCLINELNNIEDIDKRWLGIAKTDIQKGFMSLVRSIARPTNF